MLDIEREIIKARIQLLLDMPFYGNLALHLKLEEMPRWQEEEIMSMGSVPTMCTDGKTIYYNNDFIKSLLGSSTSPDNTKLQLVLAHEICLKPNTFVWNKEIKDINIGDLIIDRDGIQCVVKSKTKRKYNGGIIKIKPQGCMPIEITPNHPILTIKGGWKRHQIKNKKDRTGENRFTFDKFKWKTASEINLDDWIALPRLKIRKEYQNYIIRFPSKNYWSLTKQLQKGIRLNDDLAYLLGVYTADGCATISNRNYPSKITYITCKKCMKKIIKTHPNLKYCVECNIMNKHRTKENINQLKRYGYHRIWKEKPTKSSVVIVISLNAKKDIKIANRITKIINKYFGLKTRWVYMQNTLYILFASLPLARFLREKIGTKAGNKQIPDFILFNKNRIKQEFLKGFIDGDGYNNKKSIGFATISKKLAFQLHLLCISLGFMINMWLERRDNNRLIKLNKKKYKPTKRYSEIYTFNSSCHRTFKGLGLKCVNRTKRKTHHFKIYKNYVLARIKKIEKKRYCGYVYNLETENHTYLANNIIVHNCHLVLQHLSRMGDRNPMRWQFAVDFATNIIIHNEFERVLDGMLYDERYKGMTAEAIYNKLPEMNGKGMKGGNGYKRYSNEHTTIEIGKDGSIKVDGKKAKFYDNHKPIRGTKEEIDTLEKEWKIQASKAYQQAKIIGKHPAGMDIFIEELLQPKLNWTILMKQFIVSSAKSDFSWIPQNKKFIHQGLYLPSMTGESLGDVVCIVDNSGSTIEAQQKFFSEVNGLLQQYDVNLHLIVCDCEINSYKVYHKGDRIDLQYKGGGGTHLPVAWEFINEKMIRPNIIVCLTDGYSALPQRMDYPTLWVLSKDGVELDKIPFGMKVRMTE